jgi:hypothetical protein
MIFFSHIPKAGGSTLDMVLYQYLGNSNCIKVWDPKYGADVSAQQFVNLEENCFAGVNLVLGHLDKATSLKNEYFSRLNNRKDLITISSVRDPIERIISLYNYIRTIDGHKLNSGLDGSKEEFISFCLEQPTNLQLNYLKDNTSDTVNDVLSHTVVFNIYQSVRGFSTVLSEVTKKPLINFERVNVTKKIDDNQILYTKKDLPSSVLRELESNHDEDYQLYNIASKSYDDNVRKFTKNLHKLGQCNNYRSM